MSAEVEWCTGYSATELRRLARQSKNSNQSRRLLSLGAILGGMSRADAAKVGGMDRQTLDSMVRGIADATMRIHGQ